MKWHLGEVWLQFWLWWRINILMLVQGCALSWLSVGLKLLEEMPKQEVKGYCIARRCLAISAESHPVQCVILLLVGFCFILTLVSTPELIHNMSECFIILYTHHMARLNNPCKEVKKAHLPPFAVFWVGNDYSFPPTLRLELYPIVGNTGDSLTAPSAFSSNSCIAGDKCDGAKMWGRILWPVV